MGGKEIESFPKEEWPTTSLAEGSSISIRIIIALCQNQNF